MIKIKCMIATKASLLDVIIQLWICDVHVPSNRKEGTCSSMSVLAFPYGSSANKFELN